MPCTPVCLGDVGVDGGGGVCSRQLQLPALQLDLIEVSGWARAGGQAAVDEADRSIRIQVRTRPGGGWGLAMIFFAGGWGGVWGGGGWGGGGRMLI